MKKLWHRFLVYFSIRPCCDGATLSRVLHDTEWYYESECMNCGYIRRYWNTLW